MQDPRNIVKEYVSDEQVGKYFALSILQNGLLVSFRRSPTTPASSSSAPGCLGRGRCNCLKRNNTLHSQMNPFFTRQVPPRRPWAAVGRRLLPHDVRRHRDRGRLVLLGPRFKRGGRREGPTLEGLPAEEGIQGGGGLPNLHILQVN